MTTTIKNYWITPQGILKYSPCWTEEEVFSWFAGRKKVRLRTILKDKGISRGHRNWVFSLLVYMRPDIPQHYPPSNWFLEKILEAIE